MKIKHTALILSMIGVAGTAGAEVTVTLMPSESAPIIAKEMYGQFTEHLGNCIYGGIWVGEDSKIPNTNGYRNDVIEAIRELKVPVMRWPGGCFADEYHWMDGIGPRSERPRMVNTNWGGTVEDNSFGTHEFLNLCELVGVEPYISGNVGSGSVEEIQKWIEYMTATDGPMALLRKKNGREKPWKVKYFGVGNETWGCGGNMTAEYYSDIYRRYQTYCKNYSGNTLYKIASGGNASDYHWTDVCMKNAAKMMDGISFHYYYVDDWAAKGSATDFSDDNYYMTMGHVYDINAAIEGHSKVMDKYDPERRVGLMIDEWGTWWDVEPGTNPGHLFQQNTMRDALVAAVSLNIFHNHAARVKMANIAQSANVLQAMLLTKDEQMVKTPTFYVFKMYIPHMDARLVPLKVDCDVLEVHGRKAPVVSATASQKDGRTTISLANILLDKAQEITIDLGSIIPVKNGKPVAVGVQGEIISAKDIHDFNGFGEAEKVNIKPFKGADLKNKTVLKVKLPAASVVTLSIG